MDPADSYAAGAPPHPLIRAFLANVPSVPMAPGVSGYQVGDTYRGPAAQLEACRAGTSSACRYGDSPHNRGAPPEWAGAAVDIWPMRDGVVSENPADYAFLIQLADSMGLQSLGAMQGWDWGHFQLPGWRSLPIAPVGDSAELEDHETRSLPLLGLVLLGLGLVLRRRRR